MVALGSQAASRVGIGDRQRSTFWILRANLQSDPNLLREEPVRFQRLLAFALVLGAACAEKSKEAPLPVPAATQSVEAQAWSVIATAAQLIDVRTPEEFATGHLLNARNIPHDQIQNHVAELGELDSSIVLYCRSGNRSGQAKVVLEGLGSPRWSMPAATRP